MGPPSRPALRVRGRAWALWALAFMGMMAFIAAVGGDPAAVADVLMTGLTAGAPAALMLLIAAGLGAWATRLMRAPLGGPTMKLGLGLGVAFTVWHALGAVGLLGPVAAWAVGLIGLGGLYEARRAHRRRVASGPRDGTRSPWAQGPPGWLWTGLAGLCVLLTASSAPPGLLWSSEFGGYDALSYHLTLPSQWLGLGRVVPLSTNVYSALPSFMESAFAQLGALTLAGDGGLNSGPGWRIVSCQMLHAGLTVISAGLAAELAGVLSPRSWPARAIAIARAVAGGLVLCTPWAVVVGSLGYNEMAVVALGLAGVRWGVEPGLGPARRASATAFLIGAACGAKPTAMLLVAPGAGLALAFGLLRQHGPRGLTALIPAAAIGAATLAPWLVRNAAALGNPVFPLMTSGLGRAHWSIDQARAWQTAHAPEGGATAGLRRLVWADPQTPDDAPGVARHRGLSNRQWGLMGPLTLAALALLLLTRGTRSVAAWMSGGLAAALVAWLALTHHQSRFLIPLLVLAAPACGLAAGAITRPGFAPGSRPRWVALAFALGALPPLVQSAWLIDIWRGELGGFPAAAARLRPTDLRDRPDSDVGRDTATTVEPIPFVNASPRRGRLLMLGEARALYAAGEVIAPTLWDRTPLHDAMIEWPGEPGRWAATLREMGVEMVMVNLSELDRALRSGYIDARLGPDAARTLIDRLEVLGVWREAGVVVARVPGSPAARRTMTSDR